MTTTEATRAINDAVRAVWITLGLDIVLTLIYSTGAGLERVAIVNWLHFLIMPLFVIGLRRHSRSAAVALLVYYLGSKLFFWIGETALIGVPIALIFSWFFFRAVRATFVFSSGEPKELQPAITG